MMRHARWIDRVGVTLLLGSLAWCTAAIAQREEVQSLATTMQLYKDGNYGEAYDALRKIALDDDSDSADLSTIIQTAISCLQRLNRVNEIDEFREGAVDAHADDWRLLMAVAQSYIEVEHHGFLIGGEFQRGQHRGGGRIVRATARDRVRALQLFQRGMKIAAKADGKVDQSQLIKQFADAILFAPDGQQAWQLQALTDLAVLPDYEEGWGHYAGQPQGAPVDADGNPIFHQVPESWDAAKSDGERWRALLETMVEWHPQRRN
jgi:alpha-2-macroglobulin